MVKIYLAKISCVGKSILGKLLADYQFCVDGLIPDDIAKKIIEFLIEENEFKKYIKNNVDIC